MMGMYHDVTYGVLHLLGAGTSIANPILYGYMNENFRNEYRKFYQKMPWYRSSKMLVKSLKSQMSSKPLAKAASNSSIESGPVETQRPKGLRKLKDAQFLMSQLSKSIEDPSYSGHSKVIKRDSFDNGSNYKYKCCDYCRRGYENQLFESDHELNKHDDEHQNIACKCNNMDCDHSHNNSCDKNLISNVKSFESNYGSFDSSYDPEKCDQSHNYVNFFIKTENDRLNRSKSLKVPMKSHFKVKKTLSFEMKQLPEDSLPILERGPPKSLSIKKPKLRRKLSEIIEKPNQFSSRVNYCQRSISLNTPRPQQIRLTITGSEKSDSEETAL